MNDQREQIEEALRTIEDYSESGVVRNQCTHIRALLTPALNDDLSELQRAVGRGEAAVLDEAKALLDGLILKGWKNSPDYHRAWSLILDVVRELKRRPTREQVREAMIETYRTACTAHERSWDDTSRAAADVVAETLLFQLYPAESEDR